VQNCPEFSLNDESIRSFAPLNSAETLEYNFRVLDVAAHSPILPAFRRSAQEIQEAYAAQLQELHPANRHVRDKIRQQLQVLRDLGFVEFLGGGRYRCAS